jgi:hypothetical protein
VLQIQTVKCTSTMYFFEFAELVVLHIPHGMGVFKLHSHKTRVEKTYNFEFKFQNTSSKTLAAVWFHSWCQGVAQLAHGVSWLTGWCQGWLESPTAGLRVLRRAGGFTAGCEVSRPTDRFHGRWGVSRPVGGFTASGGFHGWL